MSLTDEIVKQRLVFSLNLFRSDLMKKLKEINTSMNKIDLGNQKEHRVGYRKELDGEAAGIASVIDLFDTSFRLYLDVYRGKF